MFTKYNLDKIVSGESVFETNQRKMNKVVCKSIAYAFLAFPVMLLLKGLGVFKFSGSLSILLLLIGAFCTLSPLVILKFVKNQVFVRYYSLICVIVLISYLGTNYYVGIYLTFALAPILSCLYFNKRFTVEIVGLSYLGFLISYYFRAAEIRDRLYPTETVFENFFPLAAGYTIEFAVTLLFLYKLVDRAHTMMVKQELMIAEMAKEEIKTSLALAATKDILFEYDIENDSFSSNGTIHGWKRKDIYIEHFMDYIDGMHWVSDEFPNAVHRYMAVPEEFGNHFQEEVQLSFIEDGTEYPVWAYFELNVIRNTEGNPVTVIGKLRDVTQMKLESVKMQEAKKFDALSGMYHYASMHKIIKEMAGHYISALHQIMIIHVKNIQDIAKCYGDVYRDFVLVNVAEIIKNAVNDKEILTCRLSDGVFLIYVADTERIDDITLRQQINTGLRELQVGEMEVKQLEYDFGYYIGEEGIDELVSVALRFVGAEDLAQMDIVGGLVDVSQNSGVIVADDKPYHSLPEADRASACDDFFKNIASLLAGTTDIQSAMRMTISRVGKFFGLSGVRIYEFPDTTQSVLSAFSWALDEQTDKACNGFLLTVGVRDFFIKNFGKSRIIDNTTGAFRDFFAKFGESPVLLEGYSSLICPVMQEEECKAVIIYDMAGSYSWTDEEKELLLGISKAISEDLITYLVDSFGKTKNAFLSNLSYEIRSPINAIMGMTEIARGQLDNMEQVEHCLDSIDTSSKQLVTIVNDVFDLSKMELGRMKLVKEVFSLEDMMAQIENQMILEAKRKDIEFILERRFQENLLYGDVSRIFQVVSYLIENALRYTKRGGSVRAMVEETANSGEEVTLFVEVQDNDEGIRQEQKEKIFVAFEQDDARQKDKYGDTGLDLAVCYHLVQMMGANLEVKGESGQGTTFYFSLKVAIPGAEQKLHFVSEQEGRKKGTVDLTDKKILLAEDNTVSAEIVKRLLERHGAIVSVAENGEVCVEKFCQSEIGEVSFILMDINMPKLNGHEATRKIRLMEREDAARVPIIAMTANAFEEDMEQSLAAGMDAHLAKPIQMKALLEEVANVLEKK